MGVIYKGQSALRIKLETGLEAEYDLSAAETRRICYKKPSGATGFWEASVTETTKLMYEVADENQLDESGMWTFWSYAVFAGHAVPGRAVKKYIYEPGQRGEG